jgi:hypothetical protein
VRNAVEVPAQVCVNHLDMACDQQALDVLYRVQGAAALAVGVLLRLEVGLEDRPKDDQRGSLYDTVSDRRDAQRPLLAVRFGDVNPPDGQGTVVLLAEAFRQVEFMSASALLITSQR